MIETDTTRANTVDLLDIERLAAALSRGDTDTIDLAGLVHDQATHSDLVPASVLAWWILSTTLPAHRWTLVLPPPGSAPLRHLARSGVISAARSRRCRVQHETGELFEWRYVLSDLTKHETRLPGIDWEVLDELTSGDRLRILDDLADGRRSIPTSQPGKLRYPWIAKLGAGSSSISPDGYRRFLADADAVLVELIDNVFRWSEAGHGVALASVTRGGGADDTGEISWNRMHIVVIDAGIGIPTALRRDVEALAAVRTAVDGTEPIGDVSDHDLVERLLRHAFGNRNITNHNGHGLNVAQIRAGQWIGTFDVVTVASEAFGGQPFRRGCRGLDPEVLEADDHELRLPGVSGTLVHLMLQATDQNRVREAAAAAEELPFNAIDFEERASRALRLEALDA